MNARDVVEMLAQALDNDDYTTAASTLSPDVTYAVGGRTLIGPDAVVASYQSASDMAHRLFDEIGYEHSIAAEGPGIFRVHYSDILTVDGESLTHRAEQVVTVAPGRGVIHIEDSPVPGEKERVDAFLERHGLSRDA